MLVRAHFVFAATRRVVGRQKGAGIRIERGSVLNCMVMRKTSQALSLQRRTDLGLSTNQTLNFAALGSTFFAGVGLKNGNPDEDAF
jgi:hypothetical protein